MKIACGFDHAGFPLKEVVLEALRADGHEVLDLGTDSTEPVDYPDVAVGVGEAVRDGRAERGVLVCGSGAGVAVAATKMVGIRAATVTDTYTAHQAVEHDDVNVLCLGARVIGPALAATSCAPTRPPRSPGRSGTGAASTRCRRSSERRAVRVIECNFCGETLVGGQRRRAGQDRAPAHGRAPSRRARTTTQQVREQAYDATDS